MELGTKSLQKYVRRQWLWFQWRGEPQMWGYRGGSLLLTRCQHWFLLVYIRCDERRLVGLRLTLDKTFFVGFQLRAMQFLRSLCRTVKLRVLFWYHSAFRFFIIIDSKTMKNSLAWVTLYLFSSFLTLDYLFEASNEFNIIKKAFNIFISQMKSKRPEPPKMLDIKGLG